MSEMIELSFDGQDGTIAAALPSQVRGDNFANVGDEDNPYLAHKDVDEEDEKDDEDTSDREGNADDDAVMPISDEHNAPVPPPEQSGETEHTKEVEKKDIGEEMSHPVSRKRFGCFKDFLSWGSSIGKG